MISSSCLALKWKFVKRSNPTLFLYSFLLWIRTMEQAKNMNLIAKRVYMLHNSYSAANNGERVNCENIYIIESDARACRRFGKRIMMKCNRVLRGSLRNSRDSRVTSGCGSSSWKSFRRATRFHAVDLCRSPERGKSAACKSRLPLRQWRISLSTYAPFAHSS